MFKKIFLIVFFFLIALPASAEEIINNFDIKIEINQDASILVTETISYDFGDAKRHGIYRDIPFKYKARDGNFNLRLSDISVVDERGYDYNFTITNNGEYKRIKIGEADSYVTGNKQYKIQYKVERAINYFDEYDELYWNATGNEWEVPIKQSKTTILFPSKINDSEVQTECFSGVAGSKNECSYVRRNYNGKDQVSEVVFINEKLNKGEGLTVVVGLPKGVILKQSIFKSMLYIIIDNWIIGFPFIVFFVMFNLWREKGRDPEGKGTIVAQFEAPGDLTPLEIGTIMNEKVDNFEISAQIIDLAVRGYIKITKVEKETIFKKSDYLIEKLKDGSDLKKEFEKMLFNALFKKKDIYAVIKVLRKEFKENGVSDRVFSEIVFGDVSDVKIEKTEEEINKKEVIKLSSLKNKFYQDLEKIKEELYKDLSSRGFFVENPKTIRFIFVYIGVIVLIILGIVAFYLDSIFALVSAILSGLLIILFGTIMPAKTRKGVLAREHILGLKKYIEVAEKDRIDFHNDPEKNPKRFEKLLSYAIALRVENQWAKQFKDVYKDVQPTWYNDTSMSGFNALALTNGLNSFSTKSNSTLSSSPSSASSGGSGFSGGGSSGGFGGGGGGSW